MMRVRKPFAAANCDAQLATQNKNRELLPETFTVAVSVLEQPWNRSVKLLEGKQKKELCHDSIRSHWARGAAL